MMRLSRLFGLNSSVFENKENVSPQKPFYELKAVTNDGNEFQFSELKGKKVLIVNVASDCGYTAQYKALHELHEKQKDKVTILGFPANDFQEQEKGSDEEIRQFCKTNYNITFLLFKKSKVVKGEGQNPVYEWLTDPNKNGWNEHQPDWNFSKYLIDEKGKLLYYFGPSISPLGEEILSAINKT